MSTQHIHASERVGSEEDGEELCGYAELMLKIGKVRGYMNEGSG